MLNLSDTESRILRVACDVFAREGFRNADVQVIADLAGVGKGTVYRHFGNKEQLFLAASKHAVEEVAAHIWKDVIGDADPDDVLANIGTTNMLRKIAASYASYYQRKPGVVELMIQERAEFRQSVFPTHLMHRAEHRGGLERLFQRGMERGELRDFETGPVADAFADMLYGSVVNGCLDGGHQHLPERVACAVEIFINGLACSPIHEE
ncbi:TetR/AcrR family transcriptional regulator [Aeoliella mucimassa]|uniref:HTH-type transcriptional repressor NicS n=1 Tax=Aeoliella mucimassa TaxID=2527972 RepID=A0A518APB1_9BACT|nr:TetR/AcrR family transcriptional regulator [Aeoliella mucimassa]QDU56554.1 HTH-type transcriptional repressor NicS [Aeoliella mucimassa]